MINSSLPLDRKKIFKQDLISRRLLIEDTTSNSADYFNVKYPAVLKAGRNKIKFKLTSKIVNNNIKIEILDGDGKVIPYIGSSYKDKDNFIVISAIIYPESNNGIGSLTILGIANKNMFENKTIENIKQYNIKWSTAIEINKYLTNTSKILFDSYPTIAVNKNFVTYNNTSYSVDKNVTVSGSFDKYFYQPQLKLTDDNILDLRRKQISQYDNQTNTGEDNQINADNEENIEIVYIKQRDTRIIAQNGFSYKTNRKPIITINQNLSGFATSHKFIKDINGASIILSNILEETLPTNYYYSGSSDANFTTTVSRVINETTIELAEPYTRSIYRLDPITNKKLYSTYVIKNITSGNIFVTYNSSPVLTQSEYYRNYADITITNLEPFIGKLDNIKTYINSNSSQTNYKLEHEEEIINKNIFVDNSNINSNYPIGYFTDITHITTHWNYNHLPDLNDTVLLDSVIIKDNALVSQTAINVYANHKYQLIFNIIGINKTDEDTIIVYGEGTSFNTTKEIARLTVDSSKRVNYHNLSLLFQPDQDGEFYVKYTSSSGLWYISNIRILPFAEFGFNPKTYNFKMPINPLWTDEIINFKFEFYNSLNEKSNQYVKVENVAFNSYTPTYITGNKNLITGSLYVGDGIGTGIEIGQSNQGAMMRSVGYEGWDRNKAGFMIWSGSVTPAGYSGSYAGIGIEFTDADKSSFQFKTQTSPQDSGSYFFVKTDEFFLGRIDTKYISGSGGVIEIYSDYFRVSPEGLLYATSGSIGGWEIQNNLLRSTGGSIQTGDPAISDEQAIVIDGTNNTFEMYISGSTNPLLKIDDDLYTGLPGILFDTNNYDKDVFFLITDSQTSPSTTLLQKGKIEVASRPSNAAYSHTAISARQYTIYDNDMYAGYFWGDRTGPETGNSDYALYASMDSKTGNDSYGIYTKATGGSNNWAGYFDDGNVKVKNELSVDGNITMDIASNASGIVYNIYSKINESGSATTYGIYGESTTSTANINYGVGGKSRNDLSSGTAIGGYFSAGSNHSTGTAYGAYFSSTDYGSGATNYAMYSSGKALFGSDIYMSLANGKIYINGIQIITAQQSTVTDPTGGIIIDVEARKAITDIIDRLQSHGLIA